MANTGFINDDLRHGLITNIRKVLPNNPSVRDIRKEDKDLPQTLYDQLILPELLKLGAGSYETIDNVLKNYVTKDTDFALTTTVPSNHPHIELLKQSAMDYSTFTIEDILYTTLIFEFRLRTENYIPINAQPRYVYGDPTKELHRFFTNRIKINF